MSLHVTVEGFPAKANVPRRFTCDGDNISPALRWEGEPAGTLGFAVIMDDPDAPGRTWNHWLLWDIPASVHALAEGGEEGKSGTNDFGKPGYSGPEPPAGKGPHRYFFRVFALDTAALALPSGAKRPALERALQHHAIAEASYMGLYERH